MGIDLSQIAGGRVGPQESDPTAFGLGIGSSEAQTETADYGPNNERLPEDLQNSLKWLVDHYTDEDQITRREEIARIRKAHFFWKGLQNIYYSGEDNSWHLPFDNRGLISSLESDDRSVPRYQFVTNIFQAYGMILMSVLSQDVPHVRFFPQSTQQQEDVATAHAATDIAELIERNNPANDLLSNLAFFLFCDGKAGGYVRYAADGDKYGFGEEDELEEGMVKLGEDSYLCPNCQGESTSGEYEKFGFCANCGEDLNPLESFRPAPVMSVPQVSRTVKTPNGKEIISIIGGLELKTPTYANEQDEFPYIQWQTEQHKARIRSAYPHAAKKIVPRGPEGANEQFERLTRLSLKQGNASIGYVTRTSASPQDVLVTYLRTWLRPWAFDLLENDEKKERLQRLFPDGAYIGFAGGVYLESRNEKMDDHWRIVHALKGDGQDRPSLGDLLISVQERFNTLTNIQMETYDYQIPSTYVDSEVLDPDSFDDQTGFPGATYFVKPRPGTPLGASFHTTQGGSVPADFIQHSLDLYGPVSQFLTGAFPALFGGEAKGAGGDTATGYQLQRNQALGRIGLVWRNVQQFYSEVMMLAVECFRKNRIDDVEIPLLGKGSDFESKWIRMADLRGNLFAYPEVQQFPSLWSEQRSILLQLMGSADPMIQRILGASDNLEFIKGLLGLRQIAVPDLDSVKKQHREISDLLQGVPQPLIDPVTGAETGLSPSVPVDGEMDDNQTELETCELWMRSQEGQKAKVDSPLGFANVRAHALAHKQALAQQQMQAVLALSPSAQAPPAGGPGPGATPAPGPVGPAEVA